MTVFSGLGGVGGSSSVTPRARRLRAARSLARVTQRFCWPSAMVRSTHLDRTQCLQRLRGGQIQLGRLEFFLDRAVQQEGERRDEEMGLHPLVGAMIDGR